MTTAYHMKSHEVTISKIIGLQPLIGRNSQLTSPDVSLILVLENEQKQTWLCEKNAPAPAAGDWFVTDSELHVSYIVAAGKFSDLFEESQP